MTMGVEMGLLRRKPLNFTDKKGKRMSHLWQLAIRAMLPTYTVVAIMKNREPGRDVKWLLDRYHSHYGKRLKVETLNRLYEEHKIAEATRTPAVLSPDLRRKLDALGKALSHGS